jgi:hypothetical protein
MNENHNISIKKQLKLTVPKVQTESKDLEQVSHFLELSVSLIKSTAFLLANRQNLIF